MMRSAPSRLSLLLGLACVGAGWGQQQTGVGSGVPAGASANRAQVEYTGGLLHVTANNSSLNQILREVGRQTGMKITGGVQDDRVFGTYGPAPASEVLASLLDGTSSNMMIVENESHGPAELILTARRGGASPPNPNAAYEQQNNQPLPQQQFQPPPQIYQNRPEGGPAPVPVPGALPPSNGGQTGAPVGSGADLGTTPGAFAGFGQTPPDATTQGSSTTSSSDVSEPQSPNGVATPQQIYEQLQKLRQQQQTTPQ